MEKAMITKTMKKNVTTQIYRTAENIFLWASELFLLRALFLLTRADITSSLNA